ncbi:hypothetical protein DSM104299_05283 [Baekduia alba]|uniref:hypothetical protein n=1 Tax=Baekduia alba TaxID=2997333 RepID=UPI002340F48D|nr:hypothetical protein [Baekduia alba]WCB96524.1 hypothetical protein DSM104299_05283 [Baekduia alba]
MTAWARIDDEDNETAVSYAARWRGSDGRIHTETARDEADALRIRTQALTERTADSDG